MSKLIKKIFIGISLMIFSVVAVCQPSGSNADSLAARESRSLKQKLTLNEVQEANIKTATKNYRIESDSIQRLSIDTSAKKLLLKSSLHNYRMEMQNILTPEQFSAYRDLIIQRRNNFRARAQAQGLTIKEIEDDF